MNVTVVYVSALRVRRGMAQETVHLPEGSRLSDLKRHLEGILAPYEASLSAAVNQAWIRGDLVLKAGDEVAFLPPVAGGLDREPVQLSALPLDTAALNAQLDDLRCGGLCVFEGRVRDHNDGQSVSGLTYEAYESMALAQMKLLRAEALEKFSVQQVVLAHRVGRLELGDAAVWIGVAAAHRDAAFEACRWLIDTVKERVPIFKKEQFGSGQERWSLLPEPAAEPTAAAN
jgi:molybdopterin synthase catalytic subunit/molybdopterin converting factor small subunit